VSPAATSAAIRRVFGVRSGWSFEEPLLERGPLRGTRAHERPPLGVAVVVDGDDVSDATAPRLRGLALEPLSVGVRSQHFHRDAAVRARVVRGPDRAHRSPAERLEQAVLGRRPAPRSSAPIIVIGVPDLLTIDEALALVSRASGRCQTKRGGRSPAAAGRVLAEDAAARVDLPPFPSSAMDGFAVRSWTRRGARARRPVRSRASAEAPLSGRAGNRDFDRSGRPGRADAVVPVERTQSEAAQCTSNRSLPVRTSVRAAVTSRRARPLFPPARGAGRRSSGRSPRPVSRPFAAHGGRALRCSPRVASFAGPASRSVPGEIYESNTVMLAAQIQRAGADAVVHGAVADDAGAMRAALERGLDADVLLTSGGVVGRRARPRRGLLADLAPQRCSGASL